MNQPAADHEGMAAFLLRMRSIGLEDRALFQAIEATPRRNFVPAQFASLAMSEGMLPIDCGEAIESIDLQARIISALSLDPTHRVLEVGTGTGFTAAVIARLSQRVVTMERYRTLTQQARQRIEALGILNVSTRHADGSNGLIVEGPYDRIVVWAAFEGMPRIFVEQLASGGVLIAPIGPPESPQAVARLTKVGSRFDREDICTARLQPLADGLAAFL